MRVRYSSDMTLNLLREEGKSPPSLCATFPSMQVPLSRQMNAPRCFVLTRSSVSLFTQSKRNLLFRVYWLDGFSPFALDILQFTCLLCLLFLSRARRKGVPLECTPHYGFKRREIDRHSIHKRTSLSMHSHCIHSLAYLLTARSKKSKI